MSAMQKNQLTKVIFRMFQGQVIALFPEEPGTENKYTCGSYAHIGQHGSATPMIVIDGSQRATAEQYANLKRELELLGYRLQVIKRYTSNHQRIRQEQLRRISDGN